MVAEEEVVLKRLSKLPGVGDKRAELLYNKGITTPEDIVEKGLSGLASIPQIGFRTAKMIMEGAKEEVEKKRDEDVKEEDDLQVLEDIERSLESLDIDEDVVEESDEIVSEEDEIDDDLRSLEELEKSLGGMDEAVEEEVWEEGAAEEDVEDWEETIEEPTEDDIEEEWEGTIEYPTEDDIEEEWEEEPEEEYDLTSELESILPSMEEEELMPDMDTAREIDKWLEEKVGIEQHIGEESVCPVCGDVVSIYDTLCDTCGVEFAQDEVKCGYCGAQMNAELVKCQDCGRALVDEKTVCPLCEGVVYASEMTCPFCSAEFDEDRVRCSECKATVPIDAIVCPHCETMLRQKIIEERSTQSGAMNVKADSTSVDVESIQLQITPGYGKGDGETSGAKNKHRKASRILFPFAAIVNQERMKRALVLNAINPKIGGVLIEGQRGTAKSVAVRGLAEILPPIEVVKDCRFSCDPREPEGWCWECQDRFEGTTEIPIETRPIRVIDLPLNATEDRVVGTLDIEKILSEGVKAFEEGILAEVNRGILYVDEINLLDDYIVDVLLDAAAMGIVTVEREEISLTYPSKFIIIGSMNPEEGALRPQLLDRMALNIKVEGIPDAGERIEIIRRNEEFEKDPHAFRESFRPKMEEFREKVIGAMDNLDAVVISEELDTVIARLSVDFEVDGHRADLIMKKTARTNAAWQGRSEVTKEDIMLAAEMTLPHRMRKGPLEQNEFNKERLKRLVEDYTR